MNKYILTIAVTGLALGSFGRLASGQEEDENRRRPNYQNHEHREERSERGGRLQSELNQLKRMLIHVDRAMRIYGADREISRQYRHMRMEAELLKDQLQRGEQNYNRRRILAQIENLRSQLHNIERQLKVRASEYYQWR